MEVAGSAFPITPLLSTCTKIVTILHNVGKKFKRAPLMMTSIATECSLINVALAQLRSFDWQAIATHADGRQEPLTRATEIIILGCTLTLSVIEEYAVELQEYVDGTPISPTEQMGIMARVRVLWKEDEMRELLLQLRGYQTGLTTLIRAAHDSDFSDAQEALTGPNSNYTLLLQRSRSSRARKPLSLRAAMQQAATYSGVSRTPSISTHSSHPSTSTLQSRQSTAASSIANNSSSPRTNNTPTFPSPAVDSCDSGANAPAGKKVTLDGTRRKRPDFLALQPKESDAVVEGRTIRTKRSKDQMRKSSPTVGDKFQFVPGLPPAKSPILEVPEDSREHTSVEESQNRKPEYKGRQPPVSEQKVEPPRTSPPQMPLPEVPLRSPSRSRSPPKSPLKSALRAPSKANTINTNHTEPHPFTSPPVKRSPIPDAPISRVGLSYGEEDIEKPPTPPTPPADPSVPSTRDGTPQPRKQKSSSSVRDQILVLPETARLRKQASNDLLRNQSSSEGLASDSHEEPVPALPASSHERMVMGNAFGRQGALSSQHNYGAALSRSRTPSFDMLQDGSRKRSATDISQNALLLESAQLTLRGKRSVQRSASDARRSPPEHLQFDNHRNSPDREYHSPTSSSIPTPSSLASPTSPPLASTDAESWPLHAEQRYQPEYISHQTHYGTRYLHPTTEYTHSRNPYADTHMAPDPARSLSPDFNSRRSMSITPTAGTPRQRSRSNTLLTITSEAGDGDREILEDGLSMNGSSMNGSTAPSVMSAQWYKSPRERLGIGPRVSKAETIPWELGEDDTDVRLEQAKARFPQKQRLGNALGVPGRAPSRMREDQESRSPPRSPLLTDGFLHNVKAGLPKDHIDIQPALPAPDPIPRPSTSMKSMKSMQSSETDARSKKSKNDKKKDTKFPTLGDMFSEYKNMGNSWYSAQYARAAEEQRGDYDGQRPATGSNSTSVSSSTRQRYGSIDHNSGSNKSTRAETPVPRPSGEMGASFSSESTGSKKSKKKKKGGSFMVMKELWSEYKSNANSWYTAPYKDETVERRDIATPAPHS